MHLHTQDVPAPAPATQPPLVEEEEDREDGPVCGLLLPPTLVRGFLQSSIPAAATNDLLLYKSLLKFKNINKAVSTKTSTSLNRHTWYLTEDLISFSLFNDGIPVEERTLLAAKIRREAAPGDLEIQKPTLPTITKDSQLLDFAGGRSRLLFELLELSTDFLQHDDWHLSDDYKTCKTALRSISAINDSAERAIALATRFNTTITRDEASHQELLQVVEFHSRFTNLQV